MVYYMTMERKQIATLAGVFLLGCMIMGASVWVRQYEPQPTWDGTQYVLEEVNSLDAAFAHAYNAPLDSLADCLVIAVNLTVLVCLSARFLRGGKKAFLFRQTAYDVFVFVLAWLYTGGAFRLLKNLAGRVRPYMYFPNPSIEGIQDGDFCRSWPSGHSASVCLAAGFFLSWLIIRKVRPQLCGVYFSLLFVPALATMTLRVFSGNHFLTDVVSGGILGFATSTAVFWLCYTAAGRSLDMLPTGIAEKQGGESGTS